MQFFFPRSARRYAVIPGDSCTKYDFIVSYSGQYTACALQAEPAIFHASVSRRRACVLYGKEKEEPEGASQKEGFYDKGR